MTTHRLSESALAFVNQVVEHAQIAFDAFRETSTITANGTVGFVERIPGEELLVSVNYPGPFRRHQPLQASVSGFDGTLYLGESPRGPSRYTRLFQAFDDITTVSHVHSPSLAAWAQTHRSLPIRYVPVQRYKLARELPVYIDRRQPEAEFIIERLQENRHLPAIIEANGGATVWGTKGLQDTAEFILLLEEGAGIQIAAEAIGGSRDYGPGVLAQQYKISGLTEQARALGLLPATNR